MAKSLAMREKTGNGQQANIQTFLNDIKAVLHDGQELLRAGVGTLKERARFGAQKTNTLVHERPYQSLGAAFGLGVLAGLLVAGMLKGASSEEED